MHGDINMAYRGSILYIGLSIAFLPFSSSVPTNTNLVYACQTNGWYIRLDTTSFGYGVTSSTADDVSLGTEKCKGRKEGHDLVFRHPYGACSTDISVSKSRVWFTNTLYMANTSTALAVAWNIQLACYMDDVQTQRVRYTPLRMTTQSVYAQTTREQQTTMQQLTETTTDTYVTTYSQYTTATEQSTAGASEPPQTRQTAVPAVCNVCSGGPCGILPAMEKTMKCPPAEPFCMNSVNKDAQGHLTYVKECAGQPRCEKLWWEQTSDDQNCIPLNTGYSGELQCHYCCTKDGCNRDFVPKTDTLYKGQD
ncbi:uncharacterized protein LOC124289246 [Haliotis rubra]|uniref:uncharacterized protein LOC124289246 n=1 Tax=Haliotis rubra TaxID=36100 RepID=UPI001EE5B3E9|nr:uncharacterized protein LOC124289246 [Haliotis rubra]